MAEGTTSLSGSTGTKEKKDKNKAVQPDVTGASSVTMEPHSDEAITKAASQVVSYGRGQQHANMREIRRLLSRLFCGPVRRLELPEEVNDPYLVPAHWVTKWVKFEKSGIGYELSDSSLGVLFTDGTRLTRLTNNMRVTYVDKAGRQHNYTLEDYPAELEKKLKLLIQLAIYMKRPVLGETARHEEYDQSIPQPFLESWIQTHSAVSFYLSNGTVQISFKYDGSRILLCPLKATVTYMDSDGASRIYRFETLEHGFPAVLFSRLKYALAVLDKLASTSA